MEEDLAGAAGATVVAAMAVTVEEVTEVADMTAVIGIVAWEEVVGGMTAVMVAAMAVTEAHPQPTTVGVKDPLSTWMSHGIIVLWCHGATVQRCLGTMPP